MVSLRNSLALIAIVALSCGCENSQTAKLRKDLGPFAEEYRKAFDETGGGIDWDSMQGSRDRYPDLAKEIDSGKFTVHWHAELDVLPTENGKRLLGYEEFAPTRGGMVLFFDGSFRTLTTAEFLAAERLSSRLEFPKPVNLMRVTNGNYLATNLASIKLPMPSGGAFNPESQAFEFKEQNASINVKLIPVEFESATASVQVALRRSGAKDIKRRQVQNTKYKAEFYEFYVHVRGDKPRKECHYSLFLSNDVETVQLHATVPAYMKDKQTFRDCLLGVDWEAHANR